MAEFPEDFNPAEVPEDEGSFALLPRGRYLMQVIESELRETPKDADIKTGQRLNLTIEVIDGPLSNRRMWDGLNIRNPSPDAQRISQRALADLCLAVGVNTLKNSDELHFKPFYGDVGIRKDRSGQDRQTIRYKAKGGAVPAGKVGAVAGAGARPAAQAQPTGQRPAAQGAKPWQQARPSAAPQRAAPARQHATMDDDIPF